jgi:hypothetical protein
MRIVQKLERMRRTCQIGVMDAPKGRLAQADRDALPQAS